ncbi:MULTISPECIES: DUF3710 domain-containing protein [Gordonia]|uniref:DUF3710 domain-containing protein n=1 Tax=Gordonia jacobaea TaxID=122202 RepID=A0ABR5IHQ9_9ACTN|nr:MULTISPECIES: DUF3710 domain-containing protein [Gordonia]KNA93102.1 hypothetical protein ABW18_01265 [Gordonia jacobaea]
MARDPESTSNASDQPLLIGQARGPYDITELDTPAEDLEKSHLDLGAVLVPVVEGGQVTVEMTADHQPEAVYLVTPYGRLTVAAFAAPKSPGLWREVVGELVDSLKNDGAATSIEDGHWGREIVAEVPGGSHRFIGVDGPRWMVRLVASGPTETASELSQLSRAVLAESVVRRGTEPAPPREMLPLVLPPVLAEQVAAAQQQMFAAEGGEVPPGVVVPDGAVTGAGDDVQPAQQAAVTEPSGAADDAGFATGDEVDSADDQPRSAGSAMQRFRRRR